MGFHIPEIIIGIPIDVIFKNIGFIGANSDEWINQIF